MSVSVRSFYQSNHGFVLSSVQSKLSQNPQEFSHGIGDEPVVVQHAATTDGRIGQLGNRVKELEDHIAALKADIKRFVFIQYKKLNTRNCCSNTKTDRFLLGYVVRGGKR